MMQMLGHAVAAAATSPSTATTLDVLLAPLGGTAAAVGIILLIIREYRSARRENVAAAKARAEAAEKDRKEADDAAEILRTRLTALEERVEELNATIRETDAKHTAELRALRESHSKELEIERNRYVQTIAVAWRLREILAENGIPVPPDLSAKRPDVKPQISPGGDDDDDGPDGAF